MTLRNVPAYKMGTATRHDSTPKSIMFNPDAGIYDPSVHITKTASAAFGFGTGKRTSFDFRNALKVPGPGEYELKPAAFNEKGKFHMGIKTNDIASFNNPGPGEYSANDNVLNKTLPSYSLRGKHFENDKNTVPGPG
jgi:hypothetical protein